MCLFKHSKLGSAIIGHSGTFERLEINTVIFGSFVTIDIEVKTV